ncbi:MAG: hypothetical protein ACRCYA_00355 [Cetobacterium sp.]|uniref:hypothetical protein n=1 Tax=Cetobacterium sp. TaxID=2071632 RepID=UPI003F387D1D
MKLVLKNIFLTLIAELVIVLVFFCIAKLLTFFFYEYYDFINNVLLIFTILQMNIGCMFVYEYFRNKQ